MLIMPKEKNVYIRLNYIKSIKKIIYTIFSKVVIYMKTLLLFKDIK